MKTRTRVPLVRRFSPVPDSPAEYDEQQFKAGFNYSSPLTWEDIDKEYRSVILAEAGTGKTCEMRARANHVATKGDYAFFIRIEDIETDFEQSFEVGDADSFQQWLAAPSDAWFYLDSVDEARLENPTAFKKAIRRFRRKIKNAQHRAHVCISSRPYAWRPHSDRQLIEKDLPLPERQVEATGSDQQATDTSKPQVALNVFLLQPLDEADIRQFAQHRSANDIDRLIDDLNRKDLMDLAGRPFDLEGILDKWRTDQTLGDSRRQLLHHNVTMRLDESHDADRALRQPLSLTRARDGAERLAAAVVLTGKADIHVPDGVHTRPGIKARAVLPDWKPADVQALLERATFDGVIYGAVRFRNREVREILAAGWFSKLLERGRSRHEIRSLFFPTQYGHRFVSPRLRVLLPWLILEDCEFRSRILTDHPEIAMEGGDPAGLPLPTRETILSDVVGRLVRHEDCGAAGDNSALARIAHADLTEHTLALVDRYPDNDEALFFLGRLVWQGAMSGCVSRLSDVAADPRHDTYTRIAATRAVTTCGTPEQRGALWDALLASDEDIPREILADLVRGANDNDIPKVLQSIDKLPADSRFSLTSVKSALRDFAGRIPLSSARDVHEPFAVFIRGLHGFLHRQPFIRSGSCDISEQFSWLLGPTIHALRRLVADRSEFAFDEQVMALLRSAPTARRQLVRVTELRADGLSELVANWPGLNDALFWYSARATRAERGRRGLGLNDDWPLQRLDHYWAFGPDSFPRILNEVRTRELEDDRRIALSLAFRVYREANDPSEWWDQLQACVNDDETMSAALDRLVNPEVPEDVAAAEREWAEHQEEVERERREAAENRAGWIARLKTDPDVVRNPPGLQPGEFSADQCCLLRVVEGDDLREERGKGSEWRTLIDEFGEDVACAYRDAAVAHWRHFRPELGSEGGNTRFFPYSLVFAMAGLAIEAAEDEGFPRHLDASEVRQALRYIVFELNGFPRWLESMYRAWPDEVLDAILTELLWELENTDPDEPIHYILHDLAVYAPWLHGALAGPLLCWIRSHDLPSDAALDYSIRILRCGALDPSDLVAVATSKAMDRSSDQRAYWYAVWVDVDPETSVDALTVYLDGLDADEGSRAAQLFITTLMGSSRGGRATGPNFGNFHTPGYLKSLYLLMHRHIRVTEDIDRTGGGVYSPGLRDEAQKAREGLFNLLAEIPGKAAYVALSELIEEHPDPSAHAWMERHARGRAEQDGDLERWTAEQVREFGDKLTRTPNSHRQLFDLTVARLTDLKDWLERGDDSPYRTWQKADDEGEVRVLVAGWLNQRWGNRFTIAQEAELANRQRMDIRLQNPSVPSAVPIELKLLDKRWTGPKLCERLRNQLVGDYMGDATGGRGVMLLFWQGNGPDKRWEIGARRVCLEDLGDALKGYWDTISNAFPNVDAVEVALIDLSLRGKRTSEGRQG